MRFQFLLLCIFWGLALPAHARLVVGATTSDLESLVRAVGGDHVTVFSVAKGTQDPHQIEAKPSFMVKFREAKLIVAHGLDLEAAWLTPLIQGARNPGIVRGSAGLLELGPELNPIEVARGDVSRAEGDVHPYGNPHFQLDPVRMGKAAILLAERLGELDVSNKELYRKNAAEFDRMLSEKLKSWEARIKKTGIKEFVSYHKSFAYFADRFGLRNDLQLEPRPGIPPTASHILKVIGEMKARKIRLVLIENYFDDSVRGKLEKEVPGSRVIKVPVSAGGDESVKTNADVIEALVSTIEKSAQ